MEKNYKFKNTPFEKEYLAAKYIEKCFEDLCNEMGRKFEGYFDQKRYLVTENQFNNIRRELGGRPDFDEKEADCFMKSNFVISRDLPHK